MTTRDLFGGETPRKAITGTVSLRMVVHDSTARAWMLGADIDRKNARWVPRGEVSRGAGRDEDVWTMPRWLAVDRGWA